MSLLSVEYPYDESSPQCARIRLGGGELSHLSSAEVNAVLRRDELLVFGLEAPVEHGPEQPEIRSKQQRDAFDDRIYDVYDSPVTVSQC